MLARQHEGHPRYPEHRSFEHRDDITAPPIASAPPRIGPPISLPSRANDPTPQSRRWSVLTRKRDREWKHVAGDDDWQREHKSRADSCGAGFSISAETTLRFSHPAEIPMTTVSPPRERAHASAPNSGWAGIWKWIRLRKSQITSAANGEIRIAASTIDVIRPAVRREC